MSMAKQIFYHNLKNGNKTEVEIFNKEIKPYIEKYNLAYWSSDEFLNEYFTQLKFNDKYAKATGSIAGQWVRNPWTIKIRCIIFKFVKGYVKKYKKLPKGEHTFNVNWYAPNAKNYLRKVLLKKQVVTFPKDIDFLEYREEN